MTHTGTLTPNGHSHQSCRSEHLAKLKQIADNATRRGEHDKAAAFIALRQKHEEAA